MNSQAFKTLEFDSLRGLVRLHAQTDPGRARIHALAPSDDYAHLTRELRAVGEMIELRQRGARLSFEGIADPTESIARLKIAGTALEPLAMLDLARLCERAVDARTAIHAEREAWPTLFEIVAPLPTELRKLSATLQKKILPSGELDDRASPQLASIRRELANARSRITRSLENLMRRSSEAIQEELVTVRNERFVIPVRADHQGRIRGVAHGSSSSGATVFVEPLETIEANNELQNLREAEQREMVEVLFALSEELRRNLVGIELAASAITELDFINSKSAFAEKFHCVVPKIAGRSAGVLPALSGEAANTSVSVPGAVATGSRGSLESKELLDPLATARGTNTLEFINARHPLLEENLRASSDQVVPVSFKLDSDHAVMVISGANAGGKTVVLKTAGLLSLMALSGLPVPAKAARVPFYRSILADIGDHQSLAANLSTFTSHVGNIASMIESCATPALVLLDEVGTGTDPEEGSALGVAVVDHFKQRGAHVLATTHYSGLKMYAANEPGVLNASVEFDEQTLQPTYRLLVGLAGSSSGLEIARRFGIPNELIQNAATNVTQSSLDAIEYLRRIKSEAEEAENLRKALEEERAAVAEKFASLDREFQKRESDRQSEFKTDLAQSISDFEKLSRELLSKIEDRAARVKVEREAEKRAAELKREAQRAAQTISAAARSQTRGRLGKSQGQEEGFPPQLRGVKVVRDGKMVGDVPRDHQQSRPTEEGGRGVRAPSIQARDFKVGDRVRLVSLGSAGIIDRIKGNEAEVRVGSLHIREKLANLELIEEMSDGQREVSTSRGSKRGSSPTVREGSLEELRRQSATTELHLHSREPDSKFRSTSELNLIGKTTDAAVDLVDKFLDEAFLNGLSEVRIIHGHGTGALRKAVAELLNDHAHVERFAPAPQDQGGAGATIAKLKS
jgi:DNA mismatch repair protein MutS2